MCHVKPYTPITCSHIEGHKSVILRRTCPKMYVMWPTIGSSLEVDVMCMCVLACACTCLVLVSNYELYTFCLIMLLCRDLISS